MPAPPVYLRPTRPAHRRRRGARSVQFYFPLKKSVLFDRDTLAHACPYFSRLRFAKGILVLLRMSNSLESRNDDPNRYEQHLILL
jgi:hypothetical protein